jgi:sugar/nucleoside kinase (ribokinase family)
MPIQLGETQRTSSWQTLGKWGSRSMTRNDEMFEVLCYGTISVDNVTRLPFLPSPKRDVSASYEYDELGGESIKVAVPLSVWGLRVLVVGNVIGTDRKARFIMEELAKYPLIDARYFRQRSEVATPFSRILVTPDGERSRIIYGFEDAPMVELLPSMMGRARVLSVDAYGQEERDRAAAVARELGRTVITADAIWHGHPLAGLSDVVIISAVWLRANFPGVYEYDHALELQSRGAGVVIITDGPRPVLVVRADGSAFGVEPYILDRVVDTSGAGDLFKAGIIYGWMRPEWPLEQRVRFACAAAALKCCHERGEPTPTLEAIEGLMRRQPG